MINFNISNIRISVIGLGYVGLPLAVEFSKKFEVIGYDIDNDRIDELILGIDRTREFNKDELINHSSLTFTRCAFN